VTPCDRKGVTEKKIELIANIRLISEKAGIE
jgi:hypothetical protein